MVTKKPKSLFFKSVLIFIFFFSLFLAARLLLMNGRFTSSDDPYYHAKHALLMEQSGKLNLVEPWLEWHFFNYAPVDFWWGFHLGLALFIHWFGLFLGVKIFTSLLGALVFLVFYLILNKLKVKYPLVWTLFLFFSSTIFGYRLFLERAIFFSMFILPLAFLFLVKGQNVWLFFLSLVYALCYLPAPFIILLTVIYLTVDAYFTKKLNLRPLIASAGGVLAGIIIHPASLNYLYVIFISIGQIFFLKFTGVDLKIGGESQAMSFSGFITSNFLALLFYILAVVLFLSSKKNSKNSVINNFLFLYSSLWLVVVLLIPRGVEYWLPITIIFIAVMFSDFSASEEFKQVKNWLASRVKFKIVVFFLISLSVLVIFYNLSNVFCNLRDNKTDELGANYQQANFWLKANTEKGSIVFYDNWGMWPMMFFYNDYNHYIIGTDPTYTYLYDQRAYWLWRNISSQGLYCGEPEPCLTLSPREQIALVPLTIKIVFRAKYAVVSNYEDSNLIRILNNLKNQVRLVFKNKDLLIYEMK